MFQWEIKKILIKNKGWIIGCLLMLFTVVFSFSSLEITELGSSTKDYLILMNQYNGKLSEDKIKAIEKDYQLYNNLKKYLSDLQRQYDNKDISKDEYISKSAYYIEKTSNIKPFRYFYNQYLEVKESEYAYLMDTRGWDVLFQDEIYSMILILSLISIAVPCFMKENECEMDQIIKTCQYGKKKFFLVKVCALIMIALGFTLVSQLLRFFIIYERFDLYGFSYPLQSIAMFNNSFINISIFYAYILCICLKVLGTVLLGVFCICIGYFIKKQIPALIVTSMMNILSFFIFQNRTIFTYIPIPGNYLFSSVYFKGPQYIQVLENSQFVDKEIFSGLTMSSLCIVVMYTIVFSIVIMYIAKCMYLSKKPKLGNIKKSVSACLMLILLCGCQQNIRDTSFVYDGMNMIEVYFKNTHIYLSAEFNQILKEDNGQIDTLIKDPLFQETIQSIFVNDEYCYYVYYKKDILCFNRVRLDNFYNEVVYKDKEVNSNNFFGFKKESEVDFTKQIFNFYVDGEYIYLFENSELYEINITKQSKKQISDNCYTGLSNYYYNGKIFYINLQQQLVSYDTITDEMYTYDKVFLNSFKIENKKVYYEDLITKQNQSMSIE